MGNSKAVYARDPQKNRELFLGYVLDGEFSTVEELLAGVYGKLAPSRLALFSELSLSPRLLIEERDIPDGDRWEHRHQNNFHRLDGKAFIAKLDRGGLSTFLAASSTDKAIVAVRPADGAVPTVMASGVVMYIPRNGLGDKVDTTMADGTVESISYDRYEALPVAL